MRAGNAALLSFVIVHFRIEGYSRPSSLSNRPLIEVISYNYTREVIIWSTRGLLLYYPNITEVYRNLYIRGAAKNRATHVETKNMAASRGAMATIWRWRRRLEAELESNFELRRLGATTRQFPISGPSPTSIPGRPKSPQNEAFLSALGVRKQGTVNPQRSARNIRGALGKSRPTHHQSGRPPFWPLIAAKHAAILALFCDFRIRPRNNGRTN